MQRAVKAAVIIFITLAVLAFLTNQLMNRVFYSPYRDYDTKAKVFYLGVQTLTPLKEDASIWHTSPLAGHSQWQKP